MKSASAPPIPADDGITHINVYSKAATQLGRDLTNFAHTPFECEDGHFESVEGYWYWLGVAADNPRRDELRTKYGWEAKQLGKQLRAPDWQDAPEFQRKICTAVDAKLALNPHIAEALAASSLPLRHYYVYNGVPNEPQQGLWVIENLEKIRARMQGLDLSAGAQPQRALPEIAAVAVTEATKSALDRFGKSELVTPAAGMKFCGSVDRIVDERIAVVLAEGGKFTLYDVRSVYAGYFEPGLHVGVTRDETGQIHVEMMPERDRTLEVIERQ